jgi:transposase
VDLIARQVVALLPDRTAATVATWLRDHPTIEIVTRDRASDYIRAIQEGAPQAQQVADRWHLLLNLREAVERVLLQVYADTKAEIQYRPTPFPLTVSAREEAVRQNHHALRQARFEAVHAAHAAGQSASVVARTCNLSRRTVDRWLQSATLPPETRGRKTGSKVDQFGDYLRRRWQEGCHDQSKLWREIVAQGFEGTRSLVGRWLRARRTQPTIPPPPPLPPAKRAAWLLCRPPDSLNAEQTAFLARLRDLPTVELTYSLAQRFVRLVCDRQAADLAPWLTDALASTLPALLSFATHLRRDFDAVSAACSLKWSNGPVEGHINRLKMLKRQMFGRAHLDLLQSRLCPSA